MIDPESRAPFSSLPDDPAVLRARIAQLEAQVRDLQGERPSLCQSQEMLQTVFEAAPFAVFLEDLSGQIVDCNPAACQMLGYSRKELLALSARDLVPPQVAESFPALIQKEMTTGGFFIESVNIRRSGEVFPVEVSSRFIELSGVPHVIVVLRDISERKTWELALAAEKERLAVTLRSIGDGVIATDNQGQVVLLNQVAEQLTGWSQAEALGRPLHEVFHIVNEQSRVRSENPVEKVLRSGRIVGLANHTALISRDGTERAIADSGAPIRSLDSQVIGVVLVFRDVTHDRRFEAELQKAQRLESVGMLAGGLAHDFNNILTAVLGNISLARMPQVSPHKLAERLENAERACLRARDLTQQLLTFAKGGAPVRRAGRLDEVCFEATRLALAGSNVACEQHVTEDLWPVQMDRGQIGQVFHNLLINAVQAMPEGGTIHMALENTVLDSDNELALCPGRYVRASVRDTGIGIASEHLPSVFDPYFTTKQKGSGLGLAISYSIIKGHEGTVSVQSQLGQGTCFCVYLPAYQQAVLAEATGAPLPVHGGGRILVMDDEEPVRWIVQAMLAELGYQCEVCKDGLEALTAYQAARDEGRPYRAVIMDLTVPGGMGGQETIRQLLAYDSTAFAIVSSGYSTDPVMASYRQWGFQGVVAKPFNLEELGRVLHEVLQR